MTIKLVCVMNKPFVLELCLRAHRFQKNIANASIKVSASSLYHFQSPVDKMFSDKIVYLRNELYCLPELSQPIVDAGVFPDTIVHRGWTYDLSKNELIDLWYCFDKLEAHRRPLALMSTISKALSRKGYCLHYMQ